MDKLKRLSVFVRVVELGSFTACATEMNLGQPAVSKAIDALEVELGARLLIRKTRSLALTDEGRQAFAEAQKVIDAYAGFADSTATQAVPAGKIRVTCSTGLGSIYVLPKLKQFQKAFPRIQVQLIITDQFLDLADHQIDVAFRLGEIERGNFVIKRVGEIDRIAVAHENYFANGKPPTRLTDLNKENCITVGSYNAPVPWLSLGANGDVVATEVSGGIAVDNYLALVSAVNAALGIGLGVRFLFENNGKLKKGHRQILKKIRFKPFPLHIAFRESRALPARIRAFIDFFYDDLKKQVWIR